MKHNNIYHNYVKLARDKFVSNAWDEENPVEICIKKEYADEFSALAESEGKSLKGVIDLFTAKIEPLCLFNSLLKYCRMREKIQIEDNIRAFRENQKQNRAKKMGKKAEIVKKNMIRVTFAIENGMSLVNYWTKYLKKSMSFIYFKKIYYKLLEDFRKTEDKISKEQEELDFTAEEYRTAKAMQKKLFEEYESNHAKIPRKSKHILQNIVLIDLYKSKRGMSYGDINRILFKNYVSSDLITSIYKQYLATRNIIQPSDLASVEVTSAEDTIKNTMISLSDEQKRQIKEENRRIQEERKARHKERYEQYMADREKRKNQRKLSKILKKNTK